MEDIITVQNGKVSAHGSVAGKLLANGMNVNALRTNATLRKDEWKHFDAAVLKAARQRMVGIADLRSRGLEFNLANGLGTTVLEYEDQSDITDAQLSMDAVSKGTKDRPEFDINYLPLPIIHKDFSFNIRQLNASRMKGETLDTTMAELAARKVVELAETMLFQGRSSYAFGGGTLYGYEDFPNRNTGSLSAAWDAGGASGTTMLTDVRAMKQASINDRYYGPWGLYIPTAYETELDDDFKAGSDKSIRQRLLEVSGISFINVADFSSAANVKLVQLTSDVVRLVVGMDVTTVEWKTEGGLVSHFKVMAIFVPQLRADQENRSGIVVYT